MYHSVLSLCVWPLQQIPQMQLRHSGVEALACHHIAVHTLSLLCLDARLSTLLQYPEKDLKQSQQHLGLGYSCSSPVSTGISLLEGLLDLISSPGLLALPLCLHTLLLAYIPARNASHQHVSLSLGSYAWQLSLQTTCVYACMCDWSTCRSISCFASTANAMHCQIQNEGT